MKVNFSMGHQLQEVGGQHLVNPSAIGCFQSKHFLNLRSVTNYTVITSKRCQQFRVKNNIHVKFSTCDSKR